MIRNPFRDFYRINPRSVRNKKKDNGEVLELIAISPPIITGTHYTGQTLTASTGTYNETPDSLTYQWQRRDPYAASWTNISGAITNEYTATSDDVKRQLRCRVTAFKSGYESVTTNTGLSESEWWDIYAILGFDGVAFYSEVNKDTNVLLDPVSSFFDLTNSIELTSPSEEARPVNRHACLYFDGTKIMQSSSPALLRLFDSSPNRSFGYVTRKTRTSGASDKIVFSAHHETLSDNPQRYSERGKFYGGAGLFLDSYFYENNELAAFTHSPSGSYRYSDTGQYAGGVENPPPIMSNFYLGGAWNTSTLNERADVGIRFWFGTNRELSEAQISSLRTVLTEKGIIQENWEPSIAMSHYYDASDIVANNADLIHEWPDRRVERPLQQTGAPNLSPYYVSNQDGFPAVRSDNVDDRISRNDLADILNGRKFTIFAKWKRFSSANQNSDAPMAFGASTVTTRSLRVYVTSGVLYITYVPGQSVLSMANVSFTLGTNGEFWFVMEVDNITGPNATVRVTSSDGQTYSNTFTGLRTDQGLINTFSMFCFDRINTPINFSDVSMQAFGILDRTLLDSERDKLVEYLEDNF